MAEFIKQLTDLVGKPYTLTDADSLNVYGQDWSRLFQPNPRIIVRPCDTEEVAEIIKLCLRHHISIVPSGGRTGLSGGAVASNQELVLSLDRINKITGFNPTDQVVTCGAGVITAQLQNFALQQGLYYPVDFASAGSSQIGGNIATNAGGIKVIKYGLTRDWVSGLTVVTAKGDILKLNNGLIKNATGYDLRHLIIGSEGTLGVITEAQMRLTVPPSNPTVMLLAIAELNDIAKVLHHFQTQIDLMAFEFFSHAALEKVIAHRGLKSPFSKKAAFYTLIEFESISGTEMEKYYHVFETAAENGWVTDGIISQSSQQAEELWQYREGISESIAHYPPYKNDIAVKPSQVSAFLQATDQFVRQNYPDFEIIWFGHIGDGNLHLNILKPIDMEIETFKKRCAKANPEIFKILQSYKGSISAEHGVGLLKKDYLHFSRSPEELALMKAIKIAFDPQNLLNPGKLF